MRKEELLRDCRKHYYGSSRATIGLVFEDVDVNLDEDAAGVREAELKKALDEEGLTVLRVGPGKAAVNGKGHSILDMLQGKKERRRSAGLRNYQCTGTG